jgi:hypothetical protein
MTVGPQGESGISQAAQVAHGLKISWPAKLRVFQDRFFELGVSDLALRHGLCDAKCDQESNREDNSSRYHYLVRSVGSPACQTPASR